MLCGNTMQSFKKLDALPESIEQTLKTLDIHFAEIRFAVRSDVRQTGTYGEEWFALTDAVIFTVAPLKTL